MKRYKFTVKEHSEYGSLGFAPKWYPAGDPLPGMAVAHDILEHFPKDDGSAEGEYQALGAALWIRGESGYFQRNGNINAPKGHISSDLPMIWRIQSHVRECKVVRDVTLMETCRETVQLGVKLVEDEYLEYSDQSIPSEIEREYIARWIATGFKRAEKRYSYTDSYTVAYQLFRGIEEAADKAFTAETKG